MRKLALAFLAFGLVLPVRADMASLRARVPEVADLKDRGSIGEQLDGLLGVVSAAGSADAVVRAENADRLTVYKERAHAQGVDLTTFMKVMGEERIKQEKAGRYVQNAQGQWIKKP